MNFSDNFFKFPIRVYDVTSMHKDREKEEKEAELIGKEVDNGFKIPDWVMGWARVPIKGLRKKLSYYDTFTMGRSTKEVVQEGFDLTCVSHIDLGDFECMWTMAKFEEKLNSCVQKYEGNRKGKLSSAPKAEGNGENSSTETK